MPSLPPISTEYLLFGAAGLVSLIAFTALILVPALGSYGRGWEKVMAAVVSLLVLFTLVVIGIAIGVLIVYFWDEIARTFG